MHECIHIRTYILNSKPHNAKYIIIIIIQVTQTHTQYYIATKYVDTH